MKNNQQLQLHAHLLEPHALAWIRPNGQLLEGLRPDESLFQVWFPSWQASNSIDFDAKMGVITWWSFDDGRWPNHRCHW